MKDFSLDIYRELLETLLAKGYELITYADYCHGIRPEKFVILRHDVDADNGGVGPQHGADLLPALAQTDDHPVRLRQQLREQREVYAGKRRVDCLQRPAKPRGRDGDAAKHGALDSGVYRNNRHHEALVLVLAFVFHVAERKSFATPQLSVTSVFSL